MGEEEIKKADQQTQVLGNDDLKNDAKPEKVESIAEKVEKLDKLIYEKRSNELKELEAKIDKKMKDFRELVDEAEKQGVTQAGQKEEPPKELSDIEFANKLWEGEI